MDAVQLLNKHIDITRFLTYYKFDRIKEDSGMIRACCKMHGGDSPTGFVANQENGLWFCHTGGCGGGDAYTLVQKMEECDFKTAVKRVAQIMDVDISDLQITERKQAHITEMQTWLRMMREKRKSPLPDYVISTEVKRVNKFRSFDASTLKHFDMMFLAELECTNKEGEIYTLRNRIGIAIHDEHGRMVGISTRRTKDDGSPKWVHQPRNVRTSDMLYNYDLVKDQPIITVAEGIFDVWAYHEIGVPAVCTYGAHLSDEQYRMLMRTGADIVLSYDGDDAGRKAFSKAAKMLINKCTLYTVNFNEGEDPESIERSVLRERYESKTKV